MELASCRARLFICAPWSVGSCATVSTHPGKPTIMHSSDLLANLNDRQYAAVTAPDKSVLILAGAGSGKTRVLTTRIAYLLQEGRANTSKILAVTFTNKAAKEMLTRLEAIVPYDLRRMWVGTFHGLCNRILRMHAQEAGLPKTFQIIDQSDQLALVKRVMQSANIDTETTDPKYVQNIVNWAKENGLRPSHLTDGDADSTARSVYELYQTTCEREGVVDFAELLLRCYELLERNEIVRRHYQSRFRHILVDEFQDTNVLQYRWLQILGGAGMGANGSSLNAVFAVGDDDQSIYAFRGANVGNMADFIRDFRVGEPIRLEQNYRSCAVILDAANALIAHNPDRLGKELWTAGERGDRIVVKELEDDREEADWIVRQIKAEYERRHSWKNFAVLYRTNAQSRGIESAMTAHGVPYVVYGGLRFFERAEVKHVLAYLRLLVNPYDDASFRRIVNVPMRGIGTKTLGDLSEEAASKGLSLWATIESWGSRIPPKFFVFKTLIEKLRAASEEMTLPDTVKLIIRTTNLAEHFRKERDVEERIGNMEEVASAAAGFLRNEGIPEDASPYEPFNEEGITPIGAFLAQATLEAGDKNEDQSTQDRVQMMTVHAAKGLEFPYVFIAGAEEGIFPHFSAQKEEGRGGVPEERRLMYVAITRAKKQLVITHARSRMMYGNHFQNPLSSFIEEIPEGLLDMRPWVALEAPPPKPHIWRERTFGQASNWAPRDKNYQKGDRFYGSSSAQVKVRRPTAATTQSSGYWVPGSADKELPSAKKVVANAAESAAGFKHGEHVEHDMFGPGVVQAVEGVGTGARIRIKFGPGVGEKQLLLSIAQTRLHKR